MEGFIIWEAIIISNIIFKTKKTNDKIVYFINITIKGSKCDIYVVIVLWIFADHRDSRAGFEGATSI